MVTIEKLIRSKRRTLALIVETNGTLTVRAPLRMRETDIRKFIEQKETWIQRKQAQAKRDAVVQRNFADGEKFLFLGEEVPLRLVPDQKPALVLDGSFKLKNSLQSQAEPIFETWYREQARSILTERVATFVHSQKIQPKKVRISSARTRWGSCSNKGTLSFTWRLVMAPMDVIDYVVVHEICHLQVMNHWAAFWTLVGDLLPDYKRRRAWLKKNGNRLKL